jgi:hypothetical protein
MNSRDRSAYERYLKSEDDSLYKVYRSFSKGKADAWAYCERLCKKKEGRRLRVIGANSNFFSAGFLYEEDGKEMFMFITHGGDRAIEVKKISEEHSE